MYYFYILFSNNLNKFYVGHTGDKLDERLRKHNTNHTGYTGKTNDWKVIYSEIFDNKTDAYARERTVKNWKSREMIEKLVSHSEHPDI